MRRWGALIALGACVLLGGSWATFRHVGFITILGLEVQKQAVEADDANQSIQLGVDLLAEGQLVAGAVQVQAALASQRPLEPGPLLAREVLTGPHANQRATSSLRIVALEGGTYTLESKVSCEVADPLSGQRTTYSKTLVASARISAESIGELRVEGGR